ncbi:hypothetical protein [Candidatus Entotheonella palauensis]|uniref:hypothetical protein n=1 Tax=Candidatus Entotheonella palauensis TaxID=93172 RepID=UPI001177FBF4|nr:hypothetical protein [Candidatus Entotheonella palauensis]
MILQVLIAMITGWINRHQQQVIAYLLEENRTRHAKLDGRRIRFTDAERRRLAALAFPIGRKQLKSLTTLATPDTLMRRYNQLVTQKFDGSQRRNKLGRPRVSDEIESLVLQMAEEALGRMIFIGEGSLRYAIHHYLTHYHSERNHQGLLLPRGGLMPSKHVQTSQLK